MRWLEQAQHDMDLVIIDEADAVQQVLDSRFVQDEELVATGQRVRPIMNEILQGKGLVEVAEDKVFVTGLKGPLEDGWQRKVEAFAARIPVPG